MAEEDKKPEDVKGVKTSSEDEQCKDDDEYKYVPDPNYKGKPYHSLPCKYLRGQSYTSSGWTKKYTHKKTCSKKRKSLKFDN